MSKETKARLNKTAVKLNLGLLTVDGTWEADEAQQKAAWEMYVELVTRVAIVDLHPDEGTLREALSSLHSLFGTTRDILRSHGPSVARSKKKHTLTFGYVAVAVLNRLLRPLLAKWHPLLSDYEETRDPKTSKVAHERAWEKATELRQALAEMRPKLRAYAEALAEAAGVESLIEPEGNAG
ncbi:MAG: hypothetical protein HYZ29_00945 [Myxococcales bacterium]|nr:hypothetical protein [Myxococcales bacterium]